MIGLCVEYTLTSDSTKKSITEVLTHVQRPDSSTELIAIILKLILNTMTVESVVDLNLTYDLVSQ